MLPIAVASLCAAAPAPQISFRAGTHPDFGRFVISPPHAAKALVSRTGDTLHIHLEAGGFATARQLPPNILRVETHGDDASLTLVPGATARVWHQASRLIVDVYPAGETPPPPGLQTQIFGPAPEVPPAKLAVAPPVAPAAPPEAPKPAPASPPAASATVAAPVQVSSSSLIAQKLDGAAALLPFAAQTGAAAFRRGDSAIIIFDEAKPLDLGGLMAEPRLGQPRLALLPSATRITLNLPPDRALALDRRAEGWEVRVVAAATGPFTRLSNNDGQIAFHVPQPGAALVIDDPDTGGRLLIGTARQPAPGLARNYRSPEFTLLATWQGVAVDPHADRLALRPDRDGFALVADSGPRLAAALGSDAALALANVGQLTRQFDFAPLPTADLRAELHMELAAAADTPKLDRFAPRLRAAQTMIALGLDREAAGVLRAAATDDPAQASNPDLQALADLATFLGSGAAGTQAWPPGDETALWRALTDPAAPARTDTVAERWRLILGYPVALKRQALPLAAAVLESGGLRSELSALLAAAPPDMLALLRARALRDSRKPDAELVALDRVAAGPDRRDAAEAARDAVELRLATGRMTVADAAAALDKHLYDWRGDAGEVAARLRLAALRAQSGALRPALALLRETEGLFPDSHDQVRDAERGVIADLLRPGASTTLAPLDLAAIAEEGADLLTERDSTAVLAPALVDKLLALDLPDRALPILEKLLAETKSFSPRAELGLRLATLRLDRGDAVGARAALRDSAAPALDATLNEKRAIISARIAATSGDIAGALAALAPLQSADALDVAAELHTAQHDWHGAAEALQRLAALRIADTPAALNEPQQALLLRLAAALSNAGDMAALQALQAKQGGRLPPGRNADLFRVLTGPPVRAVADLPRSAQEVAAAQSALAPAVPR